MTVSEFDARIRSSNERLTVENEQVRVETRALVTLLERKQRLVARLETTLAEFKTEQEMINAELRRLLTLEEQILVMGTCN